MLFFMVPLKWQEAPVLCDTRLFRLARIPLIEKEINRRAKGLIKFYDRRRYAGAYDRIIYDISSSPRDPRDQSWCAFFLSLSLSFSLYLSLSFSPSFSLFLFLSFLYAWLHLYSDRIEPRRKQQVQEITDRPAVIPKFTPTPLPWRHLSLEFSLLTISQ